MPYKIITWHYGQGLKSFLEIWKNYLEYVWKHFSVTRFLATIFSAWKRDVSRVGLRGIHPVIFLQALVQNTFTRIIGAIVKIFMILAALALETGILFGGLFLFLIWVTAPLAFLFSLGEIIFNIGSGPDFLLIFWAMTFAFSLFVVIISLRSWRAGEKNYGSMSLPRLGEEEWFKNVWNRLGLNDDQIKSGLLENQEELKKFLNDLDVSWEEFGKILDWELRNQTDKERAGKFWSRENLFSSPPIGKNWSYAYTVHLDKYARDLSQADYSEYRDALLIGKERELEQLELILTRPSQNNVIIFGEPGVGRDTLIHTLAKKIRHNRVNPALDEKRIMEVNFKEVLSEVSFQETELILEKMFREAAYAGNVILIIRDIHELLGTRQSQSGRDISPILGDFLEYPNFQIIATTTPSELHATLEKKERIMKYCDKLSVDEASKDDTFAVLFYKLRSVEKEKVIMTYQAIREIINLSERYVSDTPFPEKALDMMEEVILHWSNDSRQSFIGKETVDDAVSKKLKIPLGELTNSESQKLLDLENILHERIVGQNQAVNEIAETVRRARIGMVSKNKPLGSFLFLGPTGVGKTESAKALAESYFGDENRMIRLDMSEYQTPDSIDRIIGSATLGKEGYLINKVKENPHALLLVDEIEKAYPDILNLFLQILDEGYVNDSWGKKINFRNLIIIATSNAGSDIIKECIQQGMLPDKTKDKVVNAIIEKGIFRAELLNRFEGVIFFNPLSPEDIVKITKLILTGCAKKIKDQQNIQISFGGKLAEEIAAEAFDPVFGARAINRYVLDKVEDSIAKKIISGEIKKGSALEVNSLAGLK